MLYSVEGADDWLPTLCKVGISTEFKKEKKKNFENYSRSYLMVHVDVNVCFSIKTLVIVRNK